MEEYKKKCLICSKTFTTPRSETMFCSDKCKNVYLDKIQKGIGLELTCKVCGKKFWKQYASPFCSQDCRSFFIQQNYKATDQFSKRLAYCKKIGISYAELQKMETLNKVRCNNGEDDTESQV